jgi:hypothetical protein
VPDVVEPDAVDADPPSEDDPLEVPAAELCEPPTRLTAFPLNVTGALARTGT